MGTGVLALADGTLLAIYVSTCTAIVLAVGYALFR